MSVLGDYFTHPFHDLLSSLEQGFHERRHAIGRAADEFLAVPPAGGGGSVCLGGVGGGEGRRSTSYKYFLPRRHEWDACGAHQLKVGDLSLLFNAKPKVEPRLS